MVQLTQNVIAVFLHDAHEIFEVNIQLCPFDVLHQSSMTRQDRSDTVNLTGKLELRGG